MCGYCIMARKTRRRTQKRSRRRRGKSARKRRSRRRQRGGAACSASDSQPAAVDMAPVMDGGKKHQLPQLKMEVVVAVRPQRREVKKESLTNFSRLCLRLRKPVPPHSNTKVKPIKAVNIIV